MFERYTEAARRVVFHARSEASSSGSRYIEPVHLLLGILQEDKNLAAALIGEEQRQEQFKSEVGETIAASPQHVPISHDLPLSQEGRTL